MVDTPKLPLQSLTASSPRPGLRPGTKTGIKITGAISAALFTSLAALPTFAQSEPIPEVNPAGTPTDVRFQCQMYNGEYTVMYLPESQPGKAYPWATPTAMGGGWSAEDRCYTISDRLESYRPEGLVELQVGLENGYDTVCATTEQVPGLCKIVFTVPLGQNPVVTRDRVFENLTIADAGTDTTTVNTYTNGDSSNLMGQISDVLGSLGGDLPIPSASSSPASSRGLNLKPFLDEADGGTGTAIKDNAPTRRLDPTNFR
jgi:hypothetical protein